MYKHAVLLSLLQFASAWRPGIHKQILSKDGTDLFNATSGDQFIAARADSQEKLAHYAGTTALRGANVGSLFVFEPWIAWNEWARIGCSAYQSELDCAKALGQDGINKAMQSHWSTFYTKDDINQMQALGLNTIRIPVGYWMREDLPNRATEPFPQGGLQYLGQLCEWAAEAGLYVIIDHHAAPGAQVSMNPSTGMMAPTPGFYSTYNYERAFKFLEWIAGIIHSDPRFRTVGTLEILNEPAQNRQDLTADMRQNFYPQAIRRIRAVEAKIPMNDRLDLQFMDAAWSSGDPTTYLTSQDIQSGPISYDDHRYVKWAWQQAQSKSAYMQTSCNDVRSTSNPGGGTIDAETPLVVGEWSLSAPLDEDSKNDAQWSVQNNAPFYRAWFAAQVRSYESTAAGWIYWCWKAQGSDIRWSYKDASAAGIIPASLSSLDPTAACAPYQQ